METKETKRAKEKRKDKQKNYVKQEQEHVGQPETTYART